MGSAADEVINFYRRNASAWVPDRDAEATLYERSWIDRFMALAGNNRLDTLSKLATNPRIALLFMVPGMDETLRVFGGAEIVSGADFGSGFVTNNRGPQTVLKIAVRQAFFQCGKALMRAQLWKEETKRDRSAMPTMGEIMRDHTGHTDHVETQDEMVSRYRKQL